MSNGERCSRDNHQCLTHRRRPQFCGTSALFQVDSSLINDQRISSSASKDLRTALVSESVGKANYDGGCLASRVHCLNMFFNMFFNRPLLLGPLLGSMDQVKSHNNVPAPASVSHRPEASLRISRPLVAFCLERRGHVRTAPPVSLERGPARPSIDPFASHRSHALY